VKLDDKSKLPVVLIYFQRFWNLFISG